VNNSTTNTTVIMNNSTTNSSVTIMKELYCHVIQCCDTDGCNNMTSNSTILISNSTTPISNSTTPISNTSSIMCQQGIGSKYQLSNCSNDGVNSTQYMCVYVPPKSLCPALLASQLHVGNTKTIMSINITEANKTKSGTALMNSLFNYTEVVYGCIMTSSCKGLLALISNKTNCSGITCCDTNGCNLILNAPGTMPTSRPPNTVVPTGVNPMPEGLIPTTKTQPMPTGVSPTTKTQPMPTGVNPTTSTQPMVSPPSVSPNNQFIPTESPSNVTGIGKTPSSSTIYTTTTTSLLLIAIFTLIVNKF